MILFYLLTFRETTIDIKIEHKTRSWLQRMCCHSLEETDFGSPTKNGKIILSILSIVMKINLHAFNQ